MANPQAQETIPFPISLANTEFAVSDFVLQTIAAFNEKIEGKTLLQKRVYFVGVLTNSLPRLGYRAHFYGPYSGAVDVAVGRLCTLDFVSQKVENIPVSNNGLEVKRHSFYLTLDGKEIAVSKKDSEAGLNLSHAIKAASARISEAGDLNTFAISIAAKTHFLLQERGGEGYTTEVAEMAKNFNWNITPSQVEEAAKFLAKLELVKVSPPAHA